MKEKLKQIIQNPATKEALASMKPTRNIWGILSVIFFFFLPEFVAYVWGDDISTFAQTALKGDLALEERYYYQGLEILFGEVSYFNILFGVGLLVWLFF